MARRPGDRITTFYCGYQIKGSRRLIKAQIILADDLKARLDPAGPTEFRNSVGGEIQDDFVPFGKVLGSSDFIRKYPEATEAVNLLLKDYRLNTALKHWRNAEAAKVERSTSLTEQDVMALMPAIFRIAETTFSSSVGKPETLYVLSSEGRTRTTLDTYLHDLKAAKGRGRSVQSGARRSTSNLTKKK